MRLLKPVRSGVLRAEGRVTAGKGRLLSAEAELFDAQGVKLASGKGAFLRSAIPLAGGIGYS